MYKTKYLLLLPEADGSGTIGVYNTPQQIEEWFEDSDDQFNDGFVVEKWVEEYCEIEKMQIPYQLSWQEYMRGFAKLRIAADMVEIYLEYNDVNFHTVATVRNDSLQACVLVDSFYQESFVSEIDMVSIKDLFQSIFSKHEKHEEMASWAYEDWLNSDYSDGNVSGHSEYGEFGGDVIDEIVMRTKVHFCLNP